MDGWMDVYKCAAFFVALHFMCRYHPNLRGGQYVLIPVSLVTAHHILPHETVLEVHFHQALKNRFSYLHKKVLF